MTAVTTLAAGPVAAQRADPPTVIEPVVVTSTRLPTPAAEVGTTTTVVTRRELEASAPMSSATISRTLGRGALIGPLAGARGMPR